MDNAMGGTPSVNSAQNNVESNNETNTPMQSGITDDAKPYKKIIIITSIVLILILIPVLFIVFTEDPVVGEAIEHNIPENEASDTKTPTIQVGDLDIEINYEEVQKKALESQKKIMQDLQADIITELQKEVPGGVLDLSEAGWFDIRLLDISTNETFSVKELSEQENKPILIDTFASWNPTSIEQQAEIKKLNDELGGSFISISVNTDEDEEVVEKYLAENDYEWRFAVSQLEFTREMVNNFGVKAVNTQNAPMIMICKDKAKLLPEGIKYSEKLKEEIATGCN